MRSFWKGYEHGSDIRRSATGLLELPRAYARHGFLFELRQAARVAARHRLLRFVRDASAAVDRHEQPGAKIPATELEAASGQFCKRERARTRAFAGAQLGIERRVPHVARARRARRIPAGHRG